MEQEKKTRARSTYVDRVTLKPDVLDLVNAWLEQLKVHFKGINLSRSDLVKSHTQTIHPVCLPPSSNH